MTDRKLLRKGVFVAISSLFFYVALPYIIYTKYLVQFPQLALESYINWIMRMGVIIAGIQFFKSVSSEKTTRQALGDLLLSIVYLVFFFKLFTLEVVVDVAENVTVFISMEGFIYIYLLAALIGIFANVIRVFEVWNSARRSRSF